MKKSRLILITSLILSILLLSVPFLFASAESYTDGSVTYTLILSGSEYSISAVSVSGTDKVDIEIPSEYNGLPVTRVRESVFRSQSQISSIYIPASIKQIDKYAFSSMENLISVEFEQSDTTVKLGQNAFYYNLKLETLNIPKTSAIPASCFESCQSLKSVTIPETVTSIGVQAFSGCSSIGSVNIPAAVTHIGAKAFYNCSSVTAYTVTSGNTGYKAENGVLYTYDGTTLIQYPLGKSDTSFTVPSSAVTIGNGAFGFSKLQKVTLPQGVETIEEDAFAYSTSLSSINLPQGLTVIGVRAFSHCSALKTITIPSSVTDFEEAFSSSGLESVTLSSGLKTVSPHAFSYCASLKSVVIPGTVESIGFAAFYNCTALTTATVPASVTQIGNQAFGNCPNLTIIAADGTAAASYADSAGITRDNPNKNDGIILSAPNGTTVDYKKKVKITASASGLPSGYKVQILEGSTVRESDSSSVTYTSGELTGEKTFYARVVDSNNKQAYYTNGNAIQKEIKVSVNAGIFQKIIAFFRSIFGGQPTVTL